MNIKKMTKKAKKMGKKAKKMAGNTICNVADAAVITVALPIAAAAYTGSVLIDGIGYTVSRPIRDLNKMIDAED